MCVVRHTEIVCVFRRIRRRKLKRKRRRKRIQNNPVSKPNRGVRSSCVALKNLGWLFLYISILIYKLYNGHRSHSCSVGQSYNRICLHIKHSNIQCSCGKHITWSFVYDFAEHPFECSCSLFAAQWHSQQIDFDGPNRTAADFFNSFSFLRSLQIVIYNFFFFETMFHVSKYFSNECHRASAIYHFHFRFEINCFFFRSQRLASAYRLRRLRANRI